MKNAFSNGTKMNSTTNKVARKFMFTLLAILMTTLSWAQQQQQQLSGNGTEEYPYLINNADDWKTFTNNVNKAVSPYVNAYYRLTADLNLGTEAEPITTVVGHQRNRQFKGTFDGGFHTIHLKKKILKCLRQRCDY